jgi:sensor histidine kinase regulating citrate/malate metabolism
MPKNVYKKFNNLGILTKMFTIIALLIIIIVGVLNATFSKKIENIEKNGLQEQQLTFFRNFNSNFTLKQNIGLTSVLNIAESSEVKNALKTGNRDLAIHYLGVSK